MKKKKHALVETISYLLIIINQKLQNKKKIKIHLFGVKSYNNKSVKNQK